jgi:hypothetical protein
MWKGENYTFKANLLKVLGEMNKNLEEIASMLEIIAEK